VSGSLGLVLEVGCHGRGVDATWPTVGAAWAVGTQAHERVALAPVVRSLRRKRRCFRQGEGGGDGHPVGEAEGIAASNGRRQQQQRFLNVGAKCSKFIQYARKGSALCLAASSS
jgi:hypothetical protein